MFGFFRTHTFEDPILGRFQRTGTTWFPVEAPSGIGVTMAGGKNGPTPDVVAVAQRLLQDSETRIQSARHYLHADPKVLEFMRGNGELICDGFSVYESGSFAVEFSLSGWPDAMISVPFKEDNPCEVLLAD